MKPNTSLVGWVVVGFGSWGESEGGGGVVGGCVWGMRRGDQRGGSERAGVCRECSRGLCYLWVCVESVAVVVAEALMRERVVVVGCGFAGAQR